MDDDEAVRHSLRVLLETHDLKVTEFSSAEAALDSPLLGQCHCLIVDMEMPGMSGLEFVETMRKAADQTPVVLITANAQLSEPVRIKRNNVLALLVKPAPQNELLAWIRHSRRA